VIRNLQSAFSRLQSHRLQPVRGLLPALRRREQTAWFRQAQHAQMIPLVSIRHAFDTWKEALK